MNGCKHTPGPWEALLDIRGGGMSHAVFEKSQSIIKECLDDDCNEFTIKDTPLAEIAFVHFRPDAAGDTREGEANAQLIAAAPDLLKVAREIVDFSIGNYSRVSDAARRLLVVKRKARAAITKAEGR